MKDRNGGMEMIGQLGHTEGQSKQIVPIVQAAQRKPMVRAKPVEIPRKRHEQA